MSQTNNQPDQKPRDVPDLPLLFVIGDSISIGYGPHLKALLVPGVRYARKEGLTAALANLDIPDGANNGDSSMVLRYLESVLADPDWQPDLLLFNCGLHDIKTDKTTGAKQVPIEAYRDNLGRIVCLLNDRSLQAVWVRTTPVDEESHNTVKPFFRFAADVDAYNRVADEIMAQAGIPSLDLHTFTAELPAPFGFDGVHFLPEAQQAQAEFLAPRVRGILLELTGKE